MRLDHGNEIRADGSTIGLPTRSYILKYRVRAVY